MDINELFTDVSQQISKYLATILTHAINDGIITRDQGLRILDADYGHRSSVGLELLTDRAPQSP